MDERNGCRGSGGFTLTELLVVIVVIVLLAGILIPTVSHIQRAARAASTQALLVELQSAIEQYNQQYGGYPGPLGNNEIRVGSSLPPNTELRKPVIYDKNGTTQLPRVADYVSGAENLTLGLLGGLKLVTVGNNTVIAFDPEMVGKGPMSLNLAQPRAASAILQGVPVSGGEFRDSIGLASDSEIPEIVDRFSSPMPILYLRARKGVNWPANATMQANRNPIITYQLAVPPDAPPGSNLRIRVGSYHLEQIIGYTGAFSNRDTLDTNFGSGNGISIGEGKSLSEICTDGSGTMSSLGSKPAFHGLSVPPDPQSTLRQNEAPSRKYYFPYNAFAYFQNPQIPGTARNKDTYILISAGKDRVYGTDDDITNFGAVAP